MPNIIPSQSTWLTRVMTLAVRARSRFNTVKRREGINAACLIVIRSCRRSAAIRAARLVRPFRRLEDIVAMLPLPNRFMQQDVLFIGYLEAALGLGESLRGLVGSVATTK